MHYLSICTFRRICWLSTSLVLLACGGCNSGDSTSNESDVADSTPPESEGVGEQPGTAEQEAPPSEGDSTEDPLEETGESPADDALPTIYIPDKLQFTTEMLERRRQRQLARGDAVADYPGWSFTDRQPESGIEFLHRVVDDAGKTYESVHYDHGNGLAVADVDGDGRLDIYFVNQIGANQLWLNLGDGKFAQVTDQPELDIADRVCVGASFADIDNDGDPDLYVTSVRDGNVLLQNDGQGGFTNITEASGLGHHGHSSGALFFDYDRDGLLDLFLTNVGRYTTNEVRQRQIVGDVEGTVQPGQYTFYQSIINAFGGHLEPERTELSLLFRNVDGETFEDVTEQVGLTATGWSGDAIAFDANNDGWLDLYVLNMQGHDQYFENVEGQSFDDRSSEVFPNTSWGAMGVEVLDLENDGDLDLFVTDMHSDMFEDIGPEQEKLKADAAFDDHVPDEFLPDPEGNIYGNAFFRNNGDGSFEEISDEIGAENYWPWGLSVGDLDANGYEDAFLTSSMNYPFRYGVNSLLLNQAGRELADAEFLVGVEPRREGATVVPWFTIDFDHDKFAGLRKTLLEELSEDHHGRAVVLGAAGSRSSAIFDLDDDGDLDIVTSEFNSRPMVLLSNLSEVRPDVHYLKVALQGHRSNRHGLGAIVRVTVGDLTLTQSMDGKSGYLSQSLLPLYFGLGEASQVDRIEVTWLGGDEVQTLDGPIAVDQLLPIEESVP